MRPPNDQDYDTLRLLQLEQDRKLDSLYDALGEQQSAINGLGQQISQIDRAALSQLDQSQRRIAACIAEIRRIRAALSQVTSAVEVLQRHPSNSLEQFSRLPRKERHRYAGGLVSVVSGFAALMIARGGSIEIGDVKLSAPAIDLAALVSIVGGGSAAAYAVSSASPSKGDGG